MWLIFDVLRIVTNRLWSSTNWACCYWTCQIMPVAIIKHRLVDSTSLKNNPVSRFYCWHITNNMRNHKLPVAVDNSEKPLEIHRIWRPGLANHGKKPRILITIHLDKLPMNMEHFRTGNNHGFPLFYVDWRVIPIKMMSPTPKKKRSLLNE